MSQIQLMNGASGLGPARAAGAAWRKAIQSFRLLLHTGLRRSGTLKGHGFSRADEAATLTRLQALRFGLR
jgi:hypothetical protein